MSPARRSKSPLPPQVAPRRTAWSAGPLWVRCCARRTAPWPGPCEHGGQSRPGRADRRQRQTPQRDADRPATRHARSRRRQRVARRAAAGGHRLWCRPGWPSRTSRTAPCSTPSSVGSRSSAAPARCPYVAHRPPAQDGGAARGAGFRRPTDGPPGGRLTRRRRQPAAPTRPSATLPARRPCRPGRPSHPTAGPTRPADQPSGRRAMTPDAVQPRHRGSAAPAEPPADGRPARRAIVTCPSSHFIQARVTAPNKRRRTAHIG